MLQEDISNIVFVHYLEVKGSRVSNSYNRMQRSGDAARSSQETGEVVTTEHDGYASCSINQYDQSNHSQATDSASVNGVHTPKLEDAESVSGITIPIFTKAKQVTTFEISQSIHV